MLPVNICIEQRARLSGLLEPLAQRKKQLLVAGQSQREGFVFIQASRYELGQATRLKDACRDAAGKSSAKTCQQGQPCP